MESRQIVGSRQSVGERKVATRQARAIMQPDVGTMSTGVNYARAVSSLSRLNKTILAHYSAFNKIATLGYIMAHEGMGADHYSMSRLTMRRSHSSTGYCYILPVDEL